MSMVTVGMDPHKKTVTAVAATATGQPLAQVTVVNRMPGFLRLARWSTRWGPGPRFAVEDSREVTRRLIAALLACGFSVVRVPPKLMAACRSSARTRGKSDPIDALAVARAALREPDLPQAHLDEQALDLRLLCDRRETLVAERTAAINRLRWHLVAVDPDLEPPTRTLTGRQTQQRLSTQRQTLPATVRREITLDLLADISRLCAQTRDLEARITALVTPLAPTLLSMVGVSAITAATLIGQTAGAGRFRTSAAFAMHNGTAPIPVCSGHTAYRLNRGGNRQINACPHRIALTQLRHYQPARTFAEGYTRRKPHTTGKALLRALKRHLSDEIYHAMITDEHQQQHGQQHQAA